MYPWTMNLATDVFPIVRSLLDPWLPVVGIFVALALARQGIGFIISLRGR